MLNVRGDRRSDANFEVTTRRGRLPGESKDGRAAGKGEEGYGWDKGMLWFYETSQLGTKGRKPIKTRTKK